METANKKTSLLGGSDSKSASYNSFKSASPIMSCIEHTLSSSDTLQGLAIKYSVKVADIRKANNMWAQDNIHLKKVLLIPTAPGAPVPDGAVPITSPRKIQKKPSGPIVAGSPSALSNISPDHRGPSSHLSRTPITAFATDEFRDKQFDDNEEIFSL